MVGEILSWEEELVESKKYFLAYERLFYVGLSILKDNRILMKVLNELAKSTVHLIKAYLKYESFVGKVRLGQEFSSNVRLFIEKIAPKYLSREEVLKVVKILTLAKIHKSAPLEFVRKDNLVIYNQGKYEIFSKEKLVDYSKVIKSLIGRFPVQKDKYK